MKTVAFYANCATTSGNTMSWQIDSFAKLCFLETYENSFLLIVPQPVEIQRLGLLIAA